MSANSYFFFAYASFFVAALLFSLLMNALFLKFASTLGIRNRQDTIIRWNSQSKPALGGISFYIIFLLSITAYSFFFEESQYFLNKRFVGIVFSSTLGFLMGLYDDAYDTKPLLKLFTQITCGLMLILTGTVIHLSTFLPLNYFVTIFWVVGIMNSINMLDNMDAISSTISLSIVASVLLGIFLDGDYSNAHIILLLGVTASLIGFLRYNWYPSRMFMGDTGSQFLGAFLAAIGIIYLWDYKAPGQPAMISRQVTGALVMFSLPIIDTTTVVIKRLRKGRSPFIGGKDHTTHHLSYLGFSDRQVALVFMIISLVSIILTLTILHFIQAWSNLYVIIFGLYLLVLFGALFYIANLNRQE